MAATAVPLYTQLRVLCTDCRATACVFALHHWQTYKQQNSKTATTYPTDLLFLDVLFGAGRSTVIVML